MSRLVFSDQDDTDSSDDVYRPEEEENFDYDSDFDAPKSKGKKRSSSKFNLEFDDELPFTSKEPTKRRQYEINSSDDLDDSKSATRRFDLDFDWDDSTAPPSKKIKSKSTKRGIFDSSDESDSDDQLNKKESLMEIIHKEAQLKQKKGKNKEGILDVLNDKFYNQHTSPKPKKKVVDRLEFSDDEEDEEDEEDEKEDDLFTKGSSKDITRRMKYLPSSGSEEEEAENKRPAPGPDYDTRRLWYLRFDKKVRDSLIREFPSYSVNEINKLVSQMWKDLNEEDKKSYSQKEILKKIATSEPYAYQTLLDVKDVPEQNDKKIGRVNYANIPRKPAGNGYILYAKKELPYVRQQNPDIKNINQLSSIVGGNWKSLKQEVRDEYNAQARKERDEWIRKYPEAHEFYMEKMKSKIRVTKKAKFEVKRLKGLRKEMKRQAKEKAEQEQEQEHEQEQEQKQDSDLDWDLDSD